MIGGGRKLAGRILRAARPRLRKDQRNAVHAARRKRAAARVFRFLAFAVVAGMAATKAATIPGLPLVAVTLLGAGFGTLGARNLFLGTLSPQRLLLLRLLPIPDRVYFGSRLRSSLAGSVWLALAIAPLLFAALGRRPGLAAAAVIAEWAVVASLTVSLAPFARRLPLGRIGAALVLGGLAALFSESAGRFLASSDAVLWSLPTGWIALAARETARGEAVGPVLAAPALALVLLVALPTLRRLRDSFADEGSILSALERPGSFLRGARIGALPQELAGPTVGDDEEESEECPTARPEPLEPALAERRLLEREPWRAADHWSRRSIERAAARLFGPERKTLADLLTLGHVDWTGRLGFSAAAAAVALLLAIPAVSGPGWLVAIAVFLAVTVSTPLVGGAWRGLESGAAAHVPWGFAEAHRVLLASNLVRIAASAPIVVACGTAMELSARREAAAGAAFALRAILALALLQPGIVALRLEGGRKPESPDAPIRWNPSWSSVARILVVLVGLTASAAWCFAGQHGFELAAVSLAGICFSSAAAFLLGRHRWLRGDFL